LLKNKDKQQPSFLGVGSLGVFFHVERKTDATANVFQAREGGLEEEV